jgi:hypothetical protein
MLTLGLVVTSAAVFTFFGMEAIAIEISNPCGYDLNDLWVFQKYSLHVKSNTQILKCRPVDKYCAQLKAEMNDMMSEKVYRPNLSKPIPKAAKPTL